MSGGWFEGDAVAELVQLVDVVVVHGALGWSVGVVVVRAEVVEAGVGVAEPVPDDDEDGPANGDEGLLPASPSGQAPVALTEDRGGAAGGNGGFAQGAGEVAVAVPGGAAALLPAGGFLDPGAKRAHEHRCAAVENRLMSTPIDDHAGGGAPDPGDLIESGHRLLERGDLGVDTFLQSGGVGADGVDAGQHGGQQEGVVVVEVADERLLQLRDLHPHPGPGQLREASGVTLPAINASIIARPDTP